MPSPVKGSKKSGYYKRKGGAYKKGKGTGYKKVGAGKGTHSKRNQKQDRQRRATKDTSKGKKKWNRYPQEYD